MPDDRSIKKRPISLPGFGLLPPDKPGVISSDKPDDHPIVEHWNILIYKGECPFLYPKGNGCVHGGADRGPCSYDNCPIKSTIQGEVDHA